MVMRHTKRQGSMPHGFGQEVFFHVFLILVYVKLRTPGAGPFLPQGHNLDNFGSGLLRDATNQISRL